MPPGRRPGDGGDHDDDGLSAPGAFVVLAGAGVGTGFVAPLAAGVQGRLR